MKVSVSPTEWDLYGLRLKEFSEVRNIEPPGKPTYHPEGNHRGSKGRSAPGPPPSSTPLW